VERDLSAAVDPDGNRVRVRVLDMGSARAPLVIPRRSSVDELDVSCDEYDVRPSLLSSRDIGKIRAQELYSDLLKANCPITGQPDWATVAVRVRSRRELSRESFLRYIVSYREHGDYHEACCEQILTHLASELKPEWLSVKCFFTRRGGIDINPARFIGCAPDADYGARYWRQ
jgi:7-cyano-7-deazaguanine reductase